MRDEDHLIARGEDVIGGRDDDGIAAHDGGEDGLLGKPEVADPLTHQRMVGAEGEFCDFGTPCRNPTIRTRWPTSIAPSTVATIARGVDTAKSTPQSSVNSHSLAALLMRATTRGTANSLLASNEIARLALSSPVAAITVSQFCNSISWRVDTSQASASSQSAAGTVFGR